MRKPDRMARILNAVTGDETGAAPSTVPQRVCSAGVEVLGLTGAGLVLMSEHEKGRTVACSDRVADRLAELQFALGEGPGIDAFRLGSSVLEPDLGDPRSGGWPAFGPAALEAGAEAVFSFPLHVGAIRLGSLDLYRRRPGPLSDDQFADAVVLAEVATDGFLDLQAQVPPGSLHWRLSRSGDHRARVHQATGMIAAQQKLSVDDAMARLRAHAYGNQRSIYDVAGDVVDGRLRIE